MALISSPKFSAASLASMCHHWHSFNKDKLSLVSSLHHKGWFILCRRGTSAGCCSGCSFLTAIPDTSTGGGARNHADPEVCRVGIHIWRFGGGLEEALRRIGNGGGAPLHYASGSAVA